MSGIAEMAPFTDDIKGSFDFFRRLLGTDPVAEWPEGATFAVGDVTVLVDDRIVGMDDGPPSEDRFAIAAADLDEACSGLPGSRAFLVEPRERLWGLSAYLRDPHGRLVELTHQ